MLLKGSGAVDPRVIFDNKKNGRLEGGGGRAPRGAKQYIQIKTFLFPPNEQSESSLQN